MTKDELVTTTGVRLQATEHDIVIRRSWLNIGNVLLLGCCALVALALFLAAWFVIILLLIEFVLRPSLMMIGLALMFSVFSLPAAYGALITQGLTFPLRVTIDQERRRYKHANGIVRFSLSLPDEGVVITIHPIHSRGSWGCAAYLRRSQRGIPWLVLNGGIVGSRSAARKEANRVRAWLRTHLGDIEVTLSKWDKAT